METCRPNRSAKYRRTPGIQASQSLLPIGLKLHRELVPLPRPSASRQRGPGPRILLHKELHQLPPAPTLPRASPGKMGKNLHPVHIIQLPQVPAGSIQQPPGRCKRHIAAPGKWLAPPYPALHSESPPAPGAPPTARAANTGKTSVKKKLALSYCPSESFAILCQSHSRCILRAATEQLSHQPIQPTRHLVVALTRPRQCYSCPLKKSGAN